LIQHLGERAMRMLSAAAVMLGLAGLGMMAPQQLQAG